MKKIKSTKSCKTCKKSKNVNVLKNTLLICRLLNFIAFFSICIYFDKTTREKLNIKQSERIDPEMFLKTQMSYCLVDIFLLFFSKYIMTISQSCSLYFSTNQTRPGTAAPCQRC